MIKRIFALTLCSIALTINAQNLPKTCSAYLPKVLNKTIIFQTDTRALASNGYGQNGSTNKYWDVYSDRCSNKLYSSPNASSPNGKTLSFNQEVRIASISNGFALVYTENKKGGVNYPQISGDVKCLGWVPMENLLLWSKCPTNSYGITRKALIVRNLTHEKNDAFGKISQHPDINNKEHVSYVRANTEFHYVLKEIGTGNSKRFLIAKTDNLSDAISDRVIEGWVSENSFTPWNQRSCLEPNWGVDDVEFFISNSVEGKVYENPSMSKPIQSWVYGQKNTEGEAATQYRFPPRAMRFPILDNDSKSDETFKVTAFGSPNGKMGAAAVTIDKALDAREAALKETSHLNVIVVIDGTRSMGKYFETMSKAVLLATDYLEGDVTVGAVIYRDYSDGANSVEFHKCAKPDAASLQSFLKNIGRNGYGATSSDKDLTAHEAMYLGLATALDYNKMGYSPKNSNLVFIVGDCGNDPKDTQYTKSQIINMAKASNAQLFSFQVINQDKLPWDDFNSQLTDIFMAQMQHLYFGKQVSWKPITNGFRADPGSGTNLYVSEMHRAQVGKELSEGELTAMIQNAYKKFHKAINVQEQVIANGGMEQDASDVKSVSIDQDFLKRKLGDDYNSVVKANAMLAYEGYTKQDDGNDHIYWQPVVFISSKELIQLNTRLEPLAVAARDNSYTTESRANYVNAVAAIIHSMTEQSEAEIMQMTTDEITRIIGGLNVSTPMLKGKYTLSQIKNPSSCPDDEYKRILKTMSTKIDNLSSLTKSSRFKYQYEQNGTRYYWIPLNMIP